MADWTKEDEELFKKYAKDFEKNILFGYTDPEEIKKESDRLVKHYNIEDAHATLGNTFGRGGGSRWAKAKGLEGLVDAATMLGTTASNKTGKDHAKSKLPQNNAKMFKEAGEDLLVGEDTEKKVAGGEGQSYKTTTKASLKTNDLSAQEFKKIRDEFRKNSSEGYFIGGDDFSFDPNDPETKKLINKIKNEKITTSKDDAFYNPYMRLSDELRRDATSKAGYEYLGAHRKASKDRLEELRRKPTEIIPIQSETSNMTKPGTVLNNGVPKEKRYDNRMKQNENNAKRANNAERMLDKLAYFMDTYGNTPIGSAIRKAAKSDFDWELSKDGDSNNIPRRYKDIINTEARKPEVRQATYILRKAGETEEILKSAKTNLKNQFESMPEKNLMNVAERILGQKFTDKKTAAAILASAVANMMYSEDTSEDLIGKHKSKLYEDEGLIPSEGTYGARYNAERLAGKDRAKMLKAGDLLINDWLGKFSEKNIDEEDTEVLDEIRNLMNGYNKSKGQNIRASDDVIADILSNPVYMKMFNKYQDPMLHIK